MDFDQTPYGQDDPADTASGVGYALSMVEVARYWNRHTTAPAHLDLGAEVAEAKQARRLNEILTCLGEVSSPLAPLEVLDVEPTSAWIATALERLGFRVESTHVDPALVRSAFLFDLVLAPDSLPSAQHTAVLNLASLVRLGGTLMVAGDPEDYRPLLEPRGFRLATDDDNPGRLLAWTREN